MTDTEVIAPSKLDPETLAIRTRPPRAIRFKRGVIIAIAAVGSISLIAVTWTALKPRLFYRADTQEELSQPNTRPIGDVLSGAPSTYSEVPRLGPPLPGDLGRPILEHRQEMVAAVDPGGQQLQQAQAAARERQLSELNAARQSGVLVQNRQASSAVEASTAAVPTPSAPRAESPKLALDATNDPNAQAHKADFIGNVDRQGDVNPHALTLLPSAYTLSAGSVISASLITGLRSDLPGLVIAQVTENTYDSATGRLLLVPQGARLIGSYDSVVAFGQKRALIVWQRIVMPDGSSLHIDNIPATDASGYAGLQDKVDLHSWQLLKGVALSTLLGVGAQLALSGQGDLVQALRMSTQDSVSRAGNQVTQRNIGVQPTITIRPGAQIRLVVHKDLVFGSISGEQ